MIKKSSIIRRSDALTVAACEGVGEGEGEGEGKALAVGVPAAAAAAVAAWLLFCCGQSYSSKFGKVRIISEGVSTRIC